MTPYVLLLTLLAQPAIDEAQHTPTNASPSSENAEGPKAPAGSILLQNASLLDGTGAPPRPVDILVVDGEIAAIESTIDPGRAEQALDVGGQVVAPGLIDSHVHLTFAPGQSLYDWDRETLDEHLKHHLKSYVAAGVTTVLDCAGLWTEVDRVQGFVKAGAPAPRILNLGEPPSIPDSYAPTILTGLPTQSAPEELGPWLKAHQAHDPAGIKVLVEDGVFRPTWPIPEDDWFGALKEGAAGANIPLFVHAMGPEEYLAALTLEPRAILHGLDRVNDDAIEATAASGVYVVPTLNITASALWAWYPDGLDDPLLALLAHPDELAALGDPAIRDASNLALRDVATPKVPDWLARRMVKKPRFVESQIKARQDAVRGLYEAGVPLVVGSDAPGWPVMIDNIPAYSTLQEMRLLGEIGMSPEAVFYAATRVPSEMLAIDGEVGTLEVGKAADLVVMEGDPLTSIDAWRDLSYVMKGGEIRTPEGWMDQ